MTPPADPLTLAREGIRLAELATPGWTTHGFMVDQKAAELRANGIVIAVFRDNSTRKTDREIESCANLDLAAHAGQHYATLCRELLAAHGRGEAMGAEIVRLRDLVDSAYHEGWGDGERIGMSNGQSWSGSHDRTSATDDWSFSESRKALTPETKT